MAKEMHHLNVGDQEFEVVDAYSRTEISGAAEQISDLSDQISSAADQISDLSERDYIEAQGTTTVSGVVWTFRKWHSGIAECWGKYTFSDKFTTPRNAPFYAPESGAAYVAVNFPTNLFNAVPNCNISGVVASAWNYPLGWMGSISSSGFEFTPVLTGQSSSSVTVVYHIHATGTWK